MSEVNYKDTLNLPKTSFPMRANLTQREPQFLKNWEDEGLYEKIKEKSKGSKKYILHDGPPYANGKIHIGHALNKILKDIIVKYKTMHGYNSHYVPGWDCHGLPIEHAMFKEMKIIDKAEVEQVKFRKKARRYAEKFVALQREDFKRLGIFGEWENPYLTMNPEYQASIVESFSKLYESGYIYKGEKPIHWCFDCETALAEAELEYAEKKSDSIIVRMKINVEKSKKSDAYELIKECSEGRSAYILIWTTTPWTLPANVAVAVHPDLKYGMFKIDDDLYIIASDLAEQVEEKIGKKVKTFLSKDKIYEAGADGKSLKSLVYSHPFVDRESEVVLANYVSNEDGTGCVHIAPGHGQEDYQVGLSYKLPVISPVNEKGQFTDEFAPAAGKNVLASNQVVMDILNKEKNLIHHEPIQHSYPHCWRCKKPVIFRSTKQWFLNVDHKDLRKNLINTVQEPDKSLWIPGWGKNRILGMLEDRPDWCLSRQRYWGVPIPIMYCKKCGKEHLNKAICEKITAAFREENADCWFYRSAEHFLPDGFACESCGHAVFEKETDIIDVWFDSGVSHQAVLNSDENLEYPCSLYLEGSDQHRGWFQTSMITSVALKNIAPFKTVVTHGFVVDGEGKKMSKSAGNVIAPQDILKKYGSDILRLWVSSCDISQDVRISDDIIKQMADAYRKIRNTLRYLLGNLFDFDSANDTVPFDALDEIDKWAVGKCIDLVSEVEDDYNSFRFHHIYRMIYNFCVIEMSSFYLDVLKDRMYTAGKKSHERLSSQSAMFFILRNLVKILAPILSFTTDELWRSFTIEKTCESVHLSDWPAQDSGAIAPELIQRWDSLRELRELVNPYIENKRTLDLIGSSLEAKVDLSILNDEVYTFLKQYENQLPLVFIVSHVSLEKTEKIDADIFDAIIDFQGTQIGVCVSAAEGDKCVRCWNFSTKNGSHPDHPQLCPKCTQAIS